MTFSSAFQISSPHSNPSLLTADQEAHTSATFGTERLFRDEVRLPTLKLRESFRAGISLNFSIVKKKKKRRTH